MWVGVLVTVELKSESHTDKIACSFFFKRTKRRCFLKAYNSYFLPNWKKKKKYIFVLSTYFFYLGGKLLT